MNPSHFQISKSPTLYFAYLVWKKFRIDLILQFLRLSILLKSKCIFYFTKMKFLVLQILKLTLSFSESYNNCSLIFASFKIDPSICQFNYPLTRICVIIRTNPLILQMPKLLAPFGEKSNAFVLQMWKWTISCCKFQNWPPSFGSYKIKSSFLRAS